MLCKLYLDRKEQIKKIMVVTDYYRKLFCLVEEGILKMTQNVKYMKYDTTKILFFPWQQKL